MKITDAKRAEEKRQPLAKPRALKKGDKVAVISLSRGILGEDFVRHELELGKKRLFELGLAPVFTEHALKGLSYIEAHPEARAADLKQAFSDPEIKGIICAVGGEDTYRTLPYLCEDAAFVKLVRECPKVFTGFSDTTINHFMFHRLGMQSFYGPSFLTDLAEMAEEMLPYTKEAFLRYFGGDAREIRSSEIWYEERTDFSADKAGTERISHRETRGYEVISGGGIFTGKLLGGCLESIYDMLEGVRNPKRAEICAKYKLFPEKEEWRGNVLFIETCEQKPEPEYFRKELTALKKRGVFEAVNGVLVGKPQDEAYYEEYKAIYREIVADETLPILYNINFGHAYPRCVLPYGAEVRVDTEQKTITLAEPMFAE